MNRGYLPREMPEGRLNDASCELASQLSDFHAAGGNLSMEPEKSGDGYELRH